jgi:hypothetical protein
VGPRDLRLVRGHGGDRSHLWRGTDAARGRGWQDVRRGRPVGDRHRGEFEHTLAGFTSLGQWGKPAERVAEGAANQPLDSLQSDAALKRHLADLVALPMALAGGESQFTTGQVPQRLLSNAWVVNHFLAGRVRVEGEEGGLGNHE